MQGLIREVIAWIESLGTPLWLVIFFAILLSVLLTSGLKKLLTFPFDYYVAEIEGAESRGNLVAKLKVGEDWQSAFIAGYRRALRGLLKKFDGILDEKPVEGDVNLAPVAIAEPSTRRFWSGRAFVVCLLLSLLYTLATLVLVWVWTGQNVSGLPYYLLEDFSPLTRLVGLFLVSFSLLLFVFAWREKDANGEPANLTLGALGFFILTGATVLAATSAYLFDTVRYAFAVAAIFGAAAAAVSIAIEDRSWFVTAAAWGAVLGSFGAGYVEFSISNVVVGAVVGAIFGTCALVIAYGVATVDAWAQRWTWTGGTYLLFGLVLLALALAAFSLSPVARYANSSAILAFFVIVPIVNATLDWGSLGITRSLLSSVDGGRARPWMTALIDLGLALACLVLLSVALVAAAAAMNALAGTSGYRIIDLQSRFLALRNEPWYSAQNVWVYVMVFSTFLPSLFHGLVAIGSLATIRLPGRGWVIGVLARPGFDPAANKNMVSKVALLLSLPWYLAFLTLLALVFFLFQVLPFTLPVIGDGILWICEGLARFLGEVAVSPGEIRWVPDWVTEV